MVKYLLLLIFILIVISCSIPENLGIPTWTSKFQLYVLNDIYEASQLADEDSALVAYGDTLGFFQTMNETTELDFSTEAMTDSDNLEIGELTIEDPNPTYTAIPLSEVAEGYENGYLPAPGIPAFEMPEILKDDLEPFDQFQELLFVSGQMEFSIVNNTCIWFGDIDAGLPMVIEILDVNDNVILTQEFTEDIPPDNSITTVQSADLAGVTMYNEIKVRTSGGSRGSDGEEANVLVDATLEITVAVLSPVAQYAIAQIPEQSISDTIFVNLDEDVAMYQAILSDDEQNITIEIANEIDLEMSAVVNIDDMTLPPSNEPFSLTLTVPPSGGVGQTSYVTEIINIAGATLGDGVTALDSLEVNVDAVTVDTGDDYRQITTGDIFSVETTIDELTFALVTGVLQPQEQDEITGDSTLEVPYPYIDGEFNIVGLSTIKFEIDTPVPATLTVDLNASNDDGDIVQLVNLDTGQLPELVIEANGDIVELSSSEYNISEFISVLADSIWYTIYPVVGDPDVIFTFEEGDEIYAEITIDAILDLQAECWIIPKNEDGEPEVQAIEADFDENQLDAFVSAKLTLGHINTLGIDTSIKILFSEQKYTDFSVIAAADTTIFKIIDVPEILQSNGPDFLETEILITRSDLDFFLEDTVFVVPKIQLHSEEGTPFSGSIQMQGLMELEFEVSSGLTD